MKDVYELKRLGDIYIENGDYLSAELLFRRALDLEEQIAPNTVSLAEDFYNYALICSALGKLEVAQSYFSKAWKIERSLLGSMHPETLETFKMLSESYYEEQENTITPDFFFFAPKHDAKGEIAYH